MEYIQVVAQGISSRGGLYEEALANPLAQPAWVMFLLRFFDWPGLIRDPDFRLAVRKLGCARKLCAQEMPPVR